MELLTGPVALAALLLGSVLLVASFPLDKIIANWLAVGILAWSQIVAGSIVLSELRAIGPAGFAIWHLLIQIVAIGLWKWRGSPRPASFFAFASGEAISFARNNALATAFMVGLAGILAILVLPTSFVDSDAAHYHVPRAHYWIQNRTAHHFYTDDIRQVERPPNSSFLYMWQILITGSYRGLNLPQWLAAIGTALAIAALSRAAGHNRAAALFAGGVYLTLPAVILQMAAPWNDLLTAFGVAAFVYFVIRGLNLSAPRIGGATAHYSAYAGLSFGVMMGTKFTSFLPLPALAVLLLIFLVLRFRQRLRAMLLLAACCAVGFLLLGAYNYLLNVQDFGRPLQAYDVLASLSDNPTATSDAPEPVNATSQKQDAVSSVPAEPMELKAPVDAIGVSWKTSYSAHELANEPVVALPPEAPAGSASPIADLVRHVYQVMDWIIVKPIPGADTLYAINNNLYRQLDARLGLDLESHPEFNLSEFGMRAIRSGEIGFGPIGYAVLLIAPLTLPVLVVGVTSGRISPVSLMLLVLGLATFVTHPFVGSWTAALTRYHSGAFALMIAGLMPFAFVRRRLAATWLVPIGFLALWSAFHTATQVRRLDQEGRALAAWQASILESSLPSDAHIGVNGQVEFVHILEKFPDYRFEPVPDNELVPAFLDGGLDAALVLDPDDTFQQYRLPLEHDQSLLVGNASEIVPANLEEYGAALESRAGIATLHLQGGRLLRRLGSDVVQIFLPTTGPLELGVPLTMELTFPIPAPSSGALSMICGGSPLEATVTGHQMIVELPPWAVDPSHATQLCRLRITDLEFGQRIPSPTIQLELYPASQ